MNLQNPKKFKMLVDQAHETAINVLRPISRKYDKAEHAYPKELDMLAALLDGMNESGEGVGAANASKRGAANPDDIVNGAVTCLRHLVLLKCVMVIQAYCSVCHVKA